MRRQLVGLRPRLLAALLLTSAVTLGVAALALLGPLEQRLRQNATASLITAALEAKPTYIDAVDDHGRLNVREISTFSHDLGRRTGARVGLIDASGRRVFDTDPDIIDPFDDVRRALRTGRTIHDTRFARLRVATPLWIHGTRYVLVLRKRLTDVSAANRVVSDAFLKAAGVGLAIALLLGIGLASTLLRRLERLRDAARELEAEGLEAPSPVDHSRDEIGELARTFAAMQSRLRRQEAARRAFVATASHELRTPLASLDGMLELVEDDLSTEPLDVKDARVRVGMAKEQSRRLGHLASDLLDLSRIDAAVELRSEPVELSELSRAVMAEFEKQAAEAGASLRFLRSAQPRWARGDPGSIARVARILLDNALRVSPPGGEVTVAVGADEHGVFLSVSDQGPGVRPEERDIIFERFQRGRTAAGEGFGLGLAIGRELAVRMQGSLELVEVTTGAGFVLRLAPASVPATPVS